MSTYDYGSFSLGYDPHFQYFNTRYSLGDVSRAQDSHVSFSLGDVLHAQGLKGLTEKGKKVALIRIGLSVGGAALTALSIALVVLLIMRIIKSTGGTLGACYAVVGASAGPTLMLLGIGLLHKDLKKEKAEKYLASYASEALPGEIPLNNRSSRV